MRIPIKLFGLALTLISIPAESAMLEYYGQSVKSLKAKNGPRRG